jgi:cytochrome P450 family 1 subfamily D
MWVIGRDVSIFEDAEKFKPERFFGSAIDYKGGNIELLSFCTSRMMCLGISPTHDGESHIPFQLGVVNA